MTLKAPNPEPSRPVEGLVPDGIFAEHERYFPQVAVDVVVVHGASFLLVRRSSKNSTGHGLWATVGGRLRKNETLESGAARILKRETGMAAAKAQLEFVGVNQYFDEKTHCVSVVFKTSATSRSVALDETSSEHGWFTRRSLPPSVIPYYREMLRLGGLDLGAGPGRAR